MKVINKVVCFLSVFVLCVPFFFFNVSADTNSGSLDGDFDNSLLSSLPDFDSTDFSEYDLDFCEQALKSILIPATSDEIKDYRKDPFYLPVSVTINGTSYLGVTKRCEQTVFLYALINALKQGSIVTTSPVYYFLHSFTYESSDYLYYADNYIFSNTPFHFSSYDSTHNYIIYGKSCFKNNAVFYPMLANVGVGYSTSNSGKSFIYSTDSFKYCGLNSIDSSITNYHHKSLFCNFDIEGSELFTCDLPFSNGFSSVKPKTLSDEVDVKLTPAFGFDMDRVFDQNTGQNDYFKFEITNNSDQSIQWCSYIVASDYEDDENGINDSEDIRYLVPSYEYCKWLYITDEIYYSSSVKTVEKYLGLKTETTLIANKKTGAFYFHLLEPGDSYSDYIYWENVNIQPIKSYDIRFNCLPVDSLAFPSDMFSSRYFVDTLGSVLGSDFEKEDGFDDYVIDDTLYTEVFRCSFSVLDMPDFTLSVKGGNSIANGGFSDAETLKNNFETSTDLSDGRIHANSNHIENPLLLNGSDVNVDFDNVTIDNVKSYISYSQDFFSLIKSVLTAFPAFVWVLICFGLTGLIVIAIVKALL